MTLKELRESVSLTPAEVARRLGKSRFAVWKIEEYGKTTAATLEAYAKALGVSSDVVWQASVKTRESQPAPEKMLS